MIDRTRRFHGYNSLRTVYKHGQTVRDASLALRFMQNNRRQNYRVAVVVSRKVHKSAVIRNRIRRRIYEVIRAHSNEILQPYDLVFTVFSEQVVDLSPKQLEQLVYSQMKKAHIITSASPKPRAIVGKKEN